MRCSFWAAGALWLASTLLAEHRPSWDLVDARSAVATGRRPGSSG
jgi:hypothetical protein